MIGLTLGMVISESLINWSLMCVHHCMHCICLDQSSGRSLYRSRSYLWVEGDCTRECRVSAMQCETFCYHLAGSMWYDTNVCTTLAPMNIHLARFDDKLCVRQLNWCNLGRLTATDWKNVQNDYSICQIEAPRSIYLFGWCVPVMQSTMPITFSCALWWYSTKMRKKVARLGVAAIFFISSQTELDNENAYWHTKQNSITRPIVSWFADLMTAAAGCGFVVIHSFLGKDNI